VAAPSTGYELIQGDFTSIPAVTAEERKIMFRAAESLNELPINPTDERAVAKNIERPGDDYNRRGDVRTVLDRHGWQFVRTVGPNEQWRRPGKDRGISATIRNINGMEVFFPFTSSTAFEPNKGYTPYQVFAVLEHDSDFAAAAAELRRRGYGGNPDQPDATASTDDDFFEDLEEEETAPDDPGPFPVKLFDTPPALKTIQDYVLAKSVKPQPMFALAAAIGFAGTVLGRRVETDSGLRTNFYLLCLGPSGSGKESPRQCLKALLTAVNSTFFGGEDFASDTGLLKSLEDEPVRMFLLDEFGRFLKAMANSKSGQHLINIPTVLLKLFSSANSIFIPKLYGDKRMNFTISQPHACLFATSVRGSVYENLTSESVSDGFLARMLIFETETPEPLRQNPTREGVSNGIVETAENWIELGNIAQLSMATWRDAPTVRQVGASAGARKIYDALEERATVKRKALGENPEAALWTRVREHAEKLGVVYACCEHQTKPFVGEAAAMWGSALAEWLVAKSGVHAHGRIADNPLHAKIQ
jgi:hypothetical protein